MKKISRRDFVKGTIGVAAAGMLGACSGPAETSAAVATETPSASANPETAAVPAAPAAAAGGDGIETRYDVDILVIGGGMAGFSAAIHAIELGCGNILMIDKASGEGADWGGSSMVCGGSFLIPVSNSEADAEAYAQAVYNKGQQKGSMELIQTLASHAYGAHQWLIDQGCEYGEPYSVFLAEML